MVGRSRFQIRKVLVVSQVTFALVLLVGSGLMIRSFWHLTKVDPGFDPTNVLTFDLRLDSHYETRGDLIAFHEELLERLGSYNSVLSRVRLSHWSAGRLCMDYFPGAIH